MIEQIPNTPEVLAAPPRGTTQFNFEVPEGGPRWRAMMVFELSPTARHADRIFGGFKTADDIADYCRKHGIKGQRSLLEDCPLANVAKSLNCEAVSVDTQNGIYYEENGVPYIFFITPAMKDFIEKFDNGFYPDLVK